MFRLLFRLIFYLSLTILCVAIWTYTIGQQLPLEIRDRHFSDRLYSFLFLGTPIAALLTVFGTVKRHYDATRNTLTLIGTVIMAVLIFYHQTMNLFNFGFGVWITTNVAYENIKYPEKQIKEQIFDVGALGYGGRRVVITEPFLKIYWKISQVDTTTLDKAQWNRVDKMGDLKL